MKTVLNDILKKSFENNAVSGAVVMCEREDGFNYTLFKNSKDIKEISPFHPVMKINGGEIVSLITRENGNGKILFIMKPCEIRAAVELKKLNQVNLEDSILISFTCAGVLDFKEGNNFKEQDKFYKEFLNGKLDENIRPACNTCVHFKGDGADISLDLFNKEIIALTGKGEEFLNGLNIKFTKEFKEGSNFKSIAELREKNFKQLIKEQKKFFKTEESIIEYFDKCIGCFACRNACPVCYCKQCYFASETFKYYPDSIAKKLDKKGALRLPMDRITFHLGRVTHMATCCVGCGMCEDVCPVNIKVSQFFKYTSADIQNTFEYTPGINREVTLPLLTFREEEFKEVED